jgi:hypothetical protein
MSPPNWGIGSNGGEGILKSVGLNLWLYPCYLFMKLYPRT